MSTQNCPSCGQRLPAPGVFLTPMERKFFNLLRSKKEPIRSVRELRIAAYGENSLVSESTARVHLDRLRIALRRTNYSVTNCPYRLIQRYKKPF